MYLMKTKKQLEEQEAKELQLKKAKYTERQLTDPGRSAESAAGQNVKDFKLDDLPDGACFRPKNVLSTDGSSETAVKGAQVGKTCS